MINKWDSLVVYANYQPNSNDIAEDFMCIAEMSAEIIYFWQIVTFPDSYKKQVNLF